MFTPIYYRKHQPHVEGKAAPPRAYLITTGHILIMGVNKEGKQVFVRQSDAIKISIFPWEWVMPRVGLWASLPFALPSSSVFFLLIENKTQMEHMNSLIFRSPTSLTMTSPQLLHVHGEMTPVSVLAVSTWKKRQDAKEPQVYRQKYTEASSYLQYISVRTTAVNKRLIFTSTVM